jgi:hypothetical protein
MSSAEYSYGDPSKYTPPQHNPVVVEHHKDGQVSMEVALVRVVLTPDESDELARMLIVAAAAARARQV